MEIQVSSMMNATEYLYSNEGALTKRILKLHLEGKSVQDISQELKVSPKRVQFLINTNGLYKQTHKPDGSGV